MSAGRGQEGSLVVAGFGIRFAAQCTPEVRAAIEASDIIYCVTGDVVAQAWLERLHPRVVSLQGLYAEDRPRGATYELMVEAIVGAVQSGMRVCAVFYGHPGVYVYPSHEAVRRLRAAGHTAVMLPAISAEDCLYADLGVDPGRLGCQSYEATDFLIYKRRIDPTASLVLWQVGAIGEAFLPSISTNRDRLKVLSDVLRETYPDDHVVTIYEAATLPVTRARVEKKALVELPSVATTQQSTLYVPPFAAPQPNVARLTLLGISSPEK